MAGVPIHTLVGPVIGLTGYTVTIFVVEPQVAEVNVITAVPASMAVTIPVVPTVAIATSLLVHVPEPPALLNVVVAPSHMLAVPVTGKEVFTDIVVVV
jgi:hypothetical protein